MPIPVTCPSCHARFQVSDKFAGKKGPCPKCKKPITIPKLDQQVKIDDRAHGGTKDAAGKLVLKPIERKETRLSKGALAGIIVGVVAAFGLAFAIGMMYEDKTEIPWFLLAPAAFVIAPPLAIAGYAFLRNDELEPYRGIDAIVRALACSVGYLALWLAYYMLVPLEYRRLGDEPILGAVVILPFLAVGAIISLAAFDLDIGNAVMHYMVYVIACILLALTMGWPMIPPPSQPEETAPAVKPVGPFGK
ncbi:MAG: hypothetical protein DCC68_21945 [Planctomycetota bacterium]|nr:MAG: hypothetical protein DCC68_21945 [Planctomycetota bacterium]